MEKQKEMTSQKEMNETFMTNDSDDLNESHDHHEELDLSGFSKEDLIKALEQLKVTENIAKASALLKQARTQFDHLIDSERESALAKFIEEGGTPDDFELRKDKTTQKFESLFDSLRGKISEHYAQVEKDKEKNLRIKNELLEKLRTLIASEETHVSLEALKDVQEQWRKTGPVPANYNQELWANYNALIERFYNNRSIYFELKELDRKKNLEVKKELVEKAEQLVSMDSFSQAIRELKALHEEYRHIGPVPKEEQEELWNRLRAASDKIYQKRKDYLANKKARFEDHLKQKEELATKIESFTQFGSDRIDDWKAKTSELLTLQEEWKKVGPVAADKGKEVSKKFWGACKTFFANKDHFFKQLEAKKEENLKAKIAICEEAEKLKDNEDMFSTANALKDLQKKWDTIGPVPLKEKDAIFKRFKEACDIFFNRKRGAEAEKDKELYENLKLKSAVCEKIEKLVADSNFDGNEMKKLQEEWKSIGFVPKADLKNIQNRYHEAVEKFLDGMKDEGRDAEEMKFTLMVDGLKNNPDGGKKLQLKEKEIHKKIGAIKHDIDSLKNNMGFFANSPAADKLKEEINKKIEVAEKELGLLQKKLKMLRS